MTLTPSNGFFDKGHFKALHPSPSSVEEQLWIGSQFKTLQPTKPRGTARWYLFLEEPGYLELTLRGKGRWKVSISKTSTDLLPNQPTTLLVPAGQQTLHLSHISVPEVSSLSEINISKAPPKTRLLRARWRPAAAHNRYQSSRAKNPTIWVFESQNAGQGAHYSPMTTNFGYFGAPFNAEGRAAGGVNFSMWAANQKSKSLPPISQMPHLLATGNPEAEFSGFGHEGSGVKIRGWEPYAHHPKSVIQALRMEVDDTFETYHGYLFNEKTQNWQLFAVGRRALKKNKPPQLKATSFCEIPGPPHIERTGDIVRKIRRRGWFYGNDKNWHQADSSQFTSRKERINKLHTVDKNGWFLLGTGGFDFIHPTPIVTTPKTHDTPIYLQPDKTAQLFNLPVSFKTRQAQTKSTSGKISYTLAPVKEATATLYYGEVDCLTFAPRKLHRTEKKGLSSELFKGHRTWKYQTSKKNFSGGSISFQVEHLRPNTTYYARVLISHPNGKSWDFESISFTTQK
ncbi:MAG: DUF3472 domain-containing protein [Akkermansiaceae bacterium]